MTSPSSRPTALITGGSRGIGLGIATRLARDGFNLVINGRRAESDVAATITALKQHHTDVLYHQGDIADPDARENMVNHVQSYFARLDVLVNNAGVAPDVRADILQASTESFDRLIDINLKAPYFLTQRVANWMLQQQQGGKLDNYRPVIINIGSMSATVASSNRGDYCLSKAALAMATKLFAARLAPEGIGVYEVRPGIIATDMTAAVKDKYDHLIANGLTIEPRWGQPDDIANAVCVLARGQLTYAPGQVLTIDGGLTLQRL